MHEKAFGIEFQWTSEKVVAVVIAYYIELSSNHRKQKGIRRSNSGHRYVNNDNWQKVKCNPAGYQQGYLKDMVAV